MLLQRTICASFLNAEHPRSGLCLCTDFANCPIRCDAFESNSKTCTFGRGSLKNERYVIFFCGGIKEVFLMVKYGNRLLPLYIDLNWTGLTWAGKT